MKSTDLGKWCGGSLSLNSSPSSSPSKPSWDFVDSQKTSVSVWSTLLLLSSLEQAIKPPMWALESSLESFSIKVWLFSRMTPKDLSQNNRPTLPLTTFKLFMKECPRRWGGKERRERKAINACLEHVWWGWREQEQKREGCEWKWFRMEGRRRKDSGEQGGPNQTQEKNIFWPTKNLGLGKEWKRRSLNSMILFLLVPQMWVWRC